MTIDRSDLNDLTAAPPLTPGAVLAAEWLEPMGLTPYRLAKCLNVPPNRILAILKGKRAITADTALRLARFFETDPQSWINLQSNYELALAQAAHGPAISRDVKPMSLAA